MPSSPQTVLVAGPTASGKSALALRLAERLGGIIINADSMQVYRELSILTARPTPAEEARVPHRLFGTVPGREAFSAGRWLEAARTEIDAAGRAGRAAILVGGTGLYFAALLNGLSPIPDIPDDVRDKWRNVLEQGGIAAIRDALAARDPAMAARLAPSDPQRLVRALEVADATGRSLGHWQERAGRPAVHGAAAVKLVVAPARAVLYRRIDARATRMIEAGALAEVEALIARGLDPALPVMKAIGVRELGPVLAGEAELDDALVAIRQATRRYAKRQLTWARARMADWRWTDPAGMRFEDIALAVGG